ncbi:hypothetical protein MA16_Dca010511 [Dendrobium catenatum]|uniref:Uncharacterized protein n=1 Tax=Dendrobium catenatum TaxID=906689 RepID=A0A2I0XF00_9ASPA|nr:hypothetical protein MA16_Dca010511 [Dendrobium catenatum]
MTTTGSSQTVKFCCLERADSGHAASGSLLTMKTAVRSNLDRKSILRKGWDSDGDIWKGLDSSFPPWENLGQQLGAFKGPWTATYKLG